MKRKQAGIRKLPKFHLPVLTWKDGRDFLYVALGSAMMAFAVDLFLVPANLALGGVTGISQIIHFYTGWPIGLMVLVGNIPLFVLGWRFLGGPRFAMRTAFSVLMFSILVDNLVGYLPSSGLTADPMLNVLYGGVVGGLGAGLIYRGRGTSGGTDVLARIFTQWRHIPISQSYLMADAAVMVLAGLTFGWERALYALVMLYISGIAAEAASTGSNVVRTALIVTARPDEVTQKILHGLNRGVTWLAGKGAYTGQSRPVLYCVVTRAEIGPLKAMVREADPKAFMALGQATEALGEGFRSWEE